MIKILKVISNTLLDKLPDWLIVVFTFISLILAFISLILSWKSYRISKRQEENSKPSFDVYLLSSKIIKREKDYVYLFEFTLSNLSSSNNSIKRLELKVSYFDDNKYYSKYFQHNNDFLKDYVIDYTQSIPFNVEGGKSTTIVAVFSIDENFKNEYEVDMYTIMLTDTYDKLYSEECSVVNEVI